METEKVLSPKMGATPELGAGSGADAQPHVEENGLKSPASLLENIFREFGERYVEIQNRASERMREIEKEMTEKEEELAQEIKDDMELDLVLKDIEKEKEKRFMEIEKKKEDEITDLELEFADRLQDLGLEVEFFIDTDSASYFNAPGFPRAYNYYVVRDTHKVVDSRNRKVYFVMVKYSELQKPWTTEYSFDGIRIEEYELVNEETPFADVLHDYIPWLLIRDMYKSHILNYISEIAKAEREGKLVETLKQIKEKVEKGAWVYDYAHFLNALMKTAEQFSISL